MKFFADLHIHSRFSRATSPQMNIPTLAQYAKWKGVSLLGTGDFTHPVWLEELKKVLQPGKKGLFTFDGTNFILQAEVNLLFYRGGRAKNVHMVLLAPSFSVAEAVNKKMWQWGDLAADGRPILHIDAREAMRQLRAVSEEIMFIPAHIWTPHFSLFGANSGFDSIDDCFGEYARYITALETGLSSDPAMNWRWSQLDQYALVSNSDSHSPGKIGREVNMFDAELDYYTIKNILETKNIKKFVSTVEFFPHEGKYHYDGHRNCGIVCTPQETKDYNGICPQCGKRLTVGVLHRVDALADRAEDEMPQEVVSFKHMIPLVEIIADCKGRGVNTKGVAQEYNRMISHFGNEMSILLDVPEEKLLKHVPERIAEGVIRVRQGAVDIRPGYDGEYGTINIFANEETVATSPQMELFK